MRRNGGLSQSDREFKRGRRELAKHRPDLALRSLRAAVDACPAARAGELSRDLYWLALSLLRLDRPELAIRSLASAQKLRPRSLARFAYEMRVNAYGMRRRSSPDLDDFYAFYSIQQSRFASSAEKDAVTRLIGDAWRSIGRSGMLAGLSPSRKLALFQSWPIAFPLFGIEAHERGKVISTDFRQGGKLLGDDRCSCGSGLPFMRCCGRVSCFREHSTE